MPKLGSRIFFVFLELWWIEQPLFISGRVFYLNSTLLSILPLLPDNLPLLNALPLVGDQLGLLLLVGLHQVRDGLNAPSKCTQIIKSKQIQPDECTHMNVP